MSRSVLDKLIAFAANDRRPYIYVLTNDRRPYIYVLVSSLIGCDQPLGLLKPESLISPLETIIILQRCE